MTKACELLVQHAFGTLSLNRVEIRCATENFKSQAIPERLKFKQEGILRKAELLYGKYVDHVVYSLIDDDWNEIKNTRV
jgi:ribosomal-protein-serine acetyltransferase